jgi:nitrate reductase gamma subunit
MTLALFTYFAYAFVIAGYSVKIVKYLSLPTHLRWELYPVIHEEGRAYGGSRFERADWWEEGPRRHPVRGFFFLLKEYFHLGEYFHRHRCYWCFLYPWHVGFVLIITFHILCFVSAVAMAWGLEVAPAAGASGIILYWAVYVTGVVSFISGVFGSLGLIVERRRDNGLAVYATPLNYVSYVFTLAVFASGLAAWLFVDPSFSEYREFWKGLVTLRFVSVEAGSAIHIVLFNLFLIYLPFTRSLHYVTRFFAFFLIRWDDEPNVRGSELEKRLQELMTQKVTWSAPHIKAGKSWVEQVGDR